MSSNREEGEPTTLTPPSTIYFKNHSTHMGLCTDNLGEVRSPGEWNGGSQYDAYVGDSWLIAKKPCLFVLRSHQAWVDYDAWYCTPTGGLSTLG